MGFMNIILLGPPGTGKGTIAQYVVDKYNIKQISSGDLLRQHVKEGTSIGKAVEAVMKKGKLVDDEIVTNLIVDKIQKNLEKGFILDGYPRNIRQADILDTILNENDIKIDLVLDIDTDEEVIFKRLTARRQCEKCKAIYGLDVPPKKEGVCDKCGGKLIIRKDDTPKVVASRLELYRNITAPVNDYYKNKGTVKTINGNQKLEKIFEDIDRVIAKIKEE